ncbi:FAS1 domain-containing protein [Erysiphe necator]|uniref:Putative fas1 domain-containing protein n=1 Tax=Uncinula necator TaxID=52586 RepID=A0A0B1P255_UNCNE|nr:FAS1 domain-containing protein [Erysiphe necator]KHJ32752.1 putative fas1 domain-containing protein [Erysiphe necator]
MYFTLLRLILAITLAKLVLSSSQIPIVELQQKSLTDQPFSSDIVMLSDILGSSRRVNGFAGIIRNFPLITSKFEDGNSNKTIVAPANTAIAAMSWKPWENPDEYNTLGSEAYEGGKGKERADQNLLRFVEAHIIPLSPWAEGEKAKTLAGREHWWHLKDGHRIIQPGDIKVLDVIRSESNDGELWIIDGVMN